MVFTICFILYTHFCLLKNFSWPFQEELIVFPQILLFDIQQKYSQRIHGQKMFFSRQTSKQQRNNGSGLLLMHAEPQEQSQQQPQHGKKPHSAAAAKALAVAADDSRGVKRPMK